MQKTLMMFERIGFERELERGGLFNKFARLRKLQSKG
jgi:hypothetical protein